jgi:hypothetical protein
MLPSTSGRVRAHTAEHVNEQIRRQTEDNVDHHAKLGSAAIGNRLSELQHEWDMERTLQTNFAVVTLIGIALGQLVNRAWFGFSGAAAGFMLQHALQGWCPPVPIFRRLGFRTSAEIDAERYALKALRGDFTGMPRSSDGREDTSSQPGA